jgi:very-short-patch-repair endonuclease
VKKSHLEEKAVRIISMNGLPEPVREHKFSADRKWRADFAWPEHMIIVEVEGGIWSGGSHGRGVRMNSDSEKYNWATTHGWRVLRYTCDTLERIPNDMHLLLRQPGVPTASQTVTIKDVPEIVRKTARSSAKSANGLFRLSRRTLKPELAEIYGKRVLRGSRH